MGDLNVEQSVGGEVQSALAAGLDAIDSPCWLSGADGRLLWVNTAWRRHTGEVAPILADERASAELTLRSGSDAAFEMSVSLPHAQGGAATLVAQVKRVTDAGDPEVRWLGLCTSTEESGRGERDRDFLMLLGERLRQLHEPEAILAHANRALGEHLGALRVGYGAVEGDWLTLRADWTNGVPSNAGSFPLESFGAGIVAENRAGRTFVSTDVRSDPRIGPEHVIAFTRWGVGAIVAVPLIKEGEFTGVLSVQSDRPRAWSAAELSVMEEAAERTWEALERARIEARLLAVQANQAFLLALGDRLRRHSSATDMLRETVEMLGRKLSADRVGYAEMDMAADLLSVDVDWVSGSLKSIVGRYSLMSFGRENIAVLASGATVRIVDAARDPIVGPEAQDTYVATGIQAAITVPLLRGEELVAVLSVQHGTPREWTDAEVRLVEEVATRTWSTLEKASAEASLRKSEERLRIALEGAQLGTWDYDMVTLEGWWSPRTCEIFGIPYQESIPPELRYTFIHPDDHARYMEQVDAAVLAGKPFSIEYRIIRRDGEVRWVGLRGVVTLDEQGSPIRATGITLDVTDRNRTEEELARSREALHQSEKLTALGSLLAGVAHELNNPLAVVVAHAALLEEEAEGTLQAADAARIRRAAERCGKIVQTFLAMARQRPPERRELDVGSVIGAALDLADYGLRTAGIVVATEIAPRLPAVEADEGQLQQVFANLIVNAQQAMLEAAAPRRLTIRAGLDADGDVRVEIADTGNGIAADAQRRIFEPFYTTKPQGAGTGVGLSFSLGVVEAHGGRLELVSSSPIGSTFALTLRPAAAERAIGLNHPSGMKQPAPATVLVVDDEEDLLGALAAILRGQGYRVLTASSGLAAKQILAERDVDLLLSDLRMPDLDGPGLFAWLERERPALARRTAFLTGDILGAEAARFLSRVGQPFLEKPFSPQAVRQLVAELAA